MCGRFSLTEPREAVRRFFDAEPAPGLPPDAPRYNICPTQVVAVCYREEGRRWLGPMRWGFIPHWQKGERDGPLLINARSETLAEKPAFREAARQRRCLVPANGFFEWSGEAGRKQPWWAAPPGGGLVAFAGVWSLWQGPAGAVRTVAIVTVPANATLSPIHDRMPLTIAPADFGLWLGEQGHGAARLMRTGPEALFRPIKVGPAVSSNRAEGPGLIEPLTG